MKSLLLLNLRFWTLESIFLFFSPSFAFLNVKIFSRWTFYKVFHDVTRIIFTLHRVSISVAFRWHHKGGIPLLPLWLRHVRPTRYLGYLGIFFNAVICISSSYYMMSKVFFSLRWWRNKLEGRLLQISSMIPLEASFEREWPLLVRPQLDALHAEHRLHWKDIKWLWVNMMAAIDRLRPVCLDFGAPCLESQEGSASNWDKCWCGSIWYEQWLWLSW